MVPLTSDKSALYQFAGVDGCASGWLLASFSGGRTQLHLAASVQEAFALMAPRGLTAIDMPIGLATAGRRGCDRLARQALGRGRASSVFAAPRRPMLACASYEEANALGKAQGPDAGGGLSKQAWNILPKIKELDEALSPALQSRRFEAHPEIAFFRLARIGAKTADAPGPPQKKKTAEGRAARLSLLQTAGAPIDESEIEGFRLDNRGCAADDILDACALALTAEARAAGEAWRFSDELRDERGLIMEIWG
ncbi:MAG: DUF429 domain-containing protein [Pseudomonadota bacterium]